MAARARRAFGDVLVSAGALLVLLLALAAIDDRVREQVALRFKLGPTIGLADAAARAGDLAEVMFEAVRAQAVAHAPLTIFALAATVLVIFMLRT